MIETESNKQQCPVTNFKFKDNFNTNTEVSKFLLLNKKDYSKISDILDVCFSNKENICIRLNLRTFGVLRQKTELHEREALIMLHQF
jgi:hypothetical protein